MNFAVSSSRQDIRSASTVVLLRDGMAGLEVLLLRRDPKAKLFRGFHVFPGGAVMPNDGEGRAVARAIGMTEAEASTRAQVAANGLSFWLAAVRETFEQCGIALATDESGGILEPERHRAILSATHEL